MGRIAPHTPITNRNMNSISFYYIACWNCLRICALAHLNQRFVCQCSFGDDVKLCTSFNTHTHGHISVSEVAAFFLVISFFSVLVLLFFLCFWTLDMDSLTCAALILLSARSLSNGVLCAIEWFSVREWKVHNVVWARFFIRIRTFEMDNIK